MAVQVVVAVNTDGRGNEDVRGMAPQSASEVSEILQGLRRCLDKELGQTAAMAQGVMTPRNDIANFLYALVRVFGEDSAVGKILKRIADFFDDIDTGQSGLSDEEKLKLAVGMALGEFAMQPQAQLSLPGWINAECFQQLLASAQGDLKEAAEGLVNKVPVRLQEFLGCAFTGPSAQLSIPGMPQLDLANIDIGKAIGCLLSAAAVYQRTNSIIQALFSFGTCMAGAIGGGGGGGAQVEHETANRCG